MKFELEFNPPEESAPATVCVILNPVGVSPTSGLPLVTRNCVTMDELEGFVQQIEKQLGKVRKEGAKFFAIQSKTL